MPASESFPADTRSLAITAAQFAGGGACQLRFHLVNPYDDAVLFARLASESDWLSPTPGEAALAAGERQGVLVTVDIARARAAVLAGAAPSGALKLTLQRLASGAAPGEALVEQVYVRLPVAVCPSCERILDADLADGVALPETCPNCFERLRACPSCGAPNSWLARTCVADDRHVLRQSADWPCLGGGPCHTGSRPERAASLSRRWSYPSVPPTRREHALEWSAPVAAWGLVAAAAATPDGDAHVFAFDALSGAPLWEPYPLSDPVYPERGGVCLAAHGKDARLYVATVEGIVTCLDALRGTRLWEVSVPGKALGALVADEASGALLVPLSTDSGGALAILEADTGTVRHLAALKGLPDVAPAIAGEVAVVHDDDGAITALSLAGGDVLWQVEAGAGFDAAPVIFGERAFCAGSDGVVRCLNLADGAELWRFAVTNAPLTGTPAVTDSLLHLPAGDGLHLISASTGRSVRRYGSPRPIRSAPVVLGGTVLFGSTDGNVWGIAPGKPLEKLYETGTVGSQIIAAPAVSDGALFVAATNGCLYALEIA